MNNPIRCFPCAEEYARLAGHRGTLVREGSSSVEFGERHLQCVWYDARLRPAALKTLAGEPIRVHHPGRWNLEAGPDFLGADLDIGGRRVRGDVEIHIAPRDWTAHGHRQDPRYAGVVLHVAYQEGEIPPDQIPAGCAQVCLAPALDALPAFSFEAIDLTAYPYAIEAPLSPLRRALAGFDADARRHLLEAAGEERLLRKTLAFAALVQTQGAPQALYRELMAALGYKQNKGAFRLLAGALPLATLRAFARGDALRAFAVLLGHSGLLPREVPPEADPGTRDLLRRCWDLWWRESESRAARVVPASAWRMDHIRPANHPFRRMMAAAWLFTRPATPDEELAAWRDQPPRAWLRQSLDWLSVGADAFWSSVDPSLDVEGVYALVGRPRAAAMLANVLVPFAAAQGHRSLFEAGLLRHLPAEPVNAVIKETAHALLGPDWPPSLIASALARQGLIQIFHDHLEKSG